MVFINSMELCKYFILENVFFFKKKICMLKLAQFWFQPYLLVLLSILRLGGQNTEQFIMVYG